MALFHFDGGGVTEVLGENLSSLADKKMPVLVDRTRGGTAWWAERGLVTIEAGSGFQALLAARHSARRGHRSQPTGGGDGHLQRRPQRPAQRGVPRR